MYQRLEKASIVLCKIGKIPFLYLGLPIGSNLRRLNCWCHLLDCIKKLLGWNNILSLGTNKTIIPHNKLLKTIVMQYGNNSIVQVMYTILFHSIKRHLTLLF
jgi:hypothetical protein